MALGDFPLNGKIAVVTGAGSGINLSFARLAVEEGARVIVADLRLTEDGERFLKEDGAKAAIFVKCDVTKRADLENLITLSEREFADVPDVYVAGAGVFEPAWSNFWDDTEGDNYAEVDINVAHPIKLSRIAIRALLKKQKRGVVLITASTAGFAGYFPSPLYCATKHAIVGFVRSMAALDEFEGIKVAAIAPGMVQTPLWTDRPDKMKQYSYSPNASLTPDAVAKAMVDLVSNGEYGGGTCLEVTYEGKRTLGTWNIEPRGIHTGNISPEATNPFFAPILGIIEKEKRGD